MEVTCLRCWSGLCHCDCLFTRQLKAKWVNYWMTIQPSHTVIWMHHFNALWSKSFQGIHNFGKKEYFRCLIWFSMDVSRWWNATYGVISPDLTSQSAYCIAYEHTQNCAQFSRQYPSISSVTGVSAACCLSCWLLNFEEWRQLVARHSMKSN